MPVLSLGFLWGLFFLPSAILRARDTFDISFFFFLSLAAPLVSSSLHCSLWLTKYLLNEGPGIISLCSELVQRNVSPRRLDHEFVNLMLKTDRFLCGLLSWTNMFIKAPPPCPEKDKKGHTARQHYLTQKVETVFALSRNHCLKRIMKISG